MGKGMQERAEQGSWQCVFDGLSWTPAFCVCRSKHEALDADRPCPVL